MKIEERQRFLIIVTVLLFAILVADKLVIHPLQSLWKARSSRIAELRREVTDGSLLLRRGQSLRARWNQMQANALPINTSQAEQQALKAFDSWAQESRVSITGITPQWKHDADDYMTLECRVDASGNLGTLTRFLYDIEKDPMALRLESVVLSARDAAGQEMTLDLRISGLVLTPARQRP